MSRVAIRLNKTGEGRSPEIVYYTYYPGRPHQFTRDNRQASTGVRVGRFILALLCASPDFVSDEWMSEVIWGDSEAGGPENMRASLTQLTHEATSLAVALGFKIERLHRQGWRVTDRPIDTNPDLEVYDIDSFGLKKAERPYGINY